jgi:hypothetical protein
MRNLGVVIRMGHSDASAGKWNGDSVFEIPRKELDMLIAGTLGRGSGRVRRGFGRFRERIQARGAVAGRTHKSERKSSARNVTAENYSCVGSLCETEVINGPRKREAERA